MRDELNVGTMNSNEKIRQKRIEMDLSQRQLANRVGISQGAIDKIERGITTQSKHLPQIAAVLGIPLDELVANLPPAQSRSLPTGTPATRNGIDSEGREYLTSSKEAASQGQRHEERQRQLRIYGAVEGGDGAVILSKDPVEFRPMPHYLANSVDAYGVYITGDSMSPRYEPGEIAEVAPHKPKKAGVDVIIYRSNVDGDERAMIKRLVRFTDTEWILKQFNPAREFSVSREEWPTCHVVVGRAPGS